MDKKSKILFAVFALLIVGSVVVTYWKIMIKKDYIIEAQADCDPYTEKCFLWQCDPNSTVEGEACIGSPDDDSWFFKVVKRNASRIPLCDPNDKNCDALTCEENEPECEYIFCDETNMVAQSAAECNDPEKYAKGNPIEKECDPEVDENCEAETDCDPKTDEDCVAEEEVACDSATEDCTTVDEESVPTEEVNAENVAPCDSAKVDVCPLGASVKPELE